MKKELLKAGLSAGIAVLTLGLTWFIGQRLSAYWAIRQKRRELELSAANEFYKLYGEFFVVWKMWNYYVGLGREQTFPSASRWELLKRACAAEASLEAILVKLVSERVLSEEEIQLLGRFRQAYQSLRESIKDNEPLKWTGHDCPEYATFKRLACHIARMIFSGDIDKLPITNQNMDSLQLITSNKWKRDVG